MYEMFIKNYINKLTKNDIVNYASKENHVLEGYEVDVIYYYIKNYWQSFLKGDSQKILYELKNKVKTVTFEKIVKLYHQYKGYL